MHYRAKYIKSIRVCSTNALRYYDEMAENRDCEQIGSSWGNGAASYTFTSVVQSGTMRLSYFHKAGSIESVLNVDLLCKAGVGVGTLKFVSRDRTTTTIGWETEEVRSELLCCDCPL